MFNINKKIVDTIKQTHASEFITKPKRVGLVGSAGFNITD